MLYAKTKVLWKIPQWCIRIQPKPQKLELSDPECFTCCCRCACPLAPRVGSLATGLRWGTPLGKTEQGENVSVYAHDLTLVIAMTTNEEGKSFINSS